jgi:hypothetical protein
VPSHELAKTLQKLEIALAPEDFSHVFRLTLIPDSGRHRRQGYVSKTTACGDIPTRTRRVIVCHGFSEASANPTPKAADLIDQLELTEKRHFAPAPYCDRPTLGPAEGYAIESTWCASGVIG